MLLGKVDGIDMYTTRQDTPLTIHAFSNSTEMRRGFLLFTTCPESVWLFKNCTMINDTFLYIIHHGVYIVNIAKCVGLQQRTDYSNYTALSRDFHATVRLSCYVLYVLLYDLYFVLLQTVAVILYILF